MTSWIRQSAAFDHDEQVLDDRKLKKNLDYFMKKLSEQEDKF
jgi:hypothetical protein